MRGQRQPLTNATNCSVFFTGVPLSITSAALRPHFESVGRVLDFRLLGPPPGKDFRYGEVDYADEKTAQVAIQRLNGHTFGERAIRVAAVEVRYRKRGRRDDVTGPGRRPPPPPPPSLPTVDDRGRPVLQFSKGFFDPVLGREDSMVLDVLKRTAVEEAYEAVEQLRVLVMERPRDAHHLLQENPALVSAVIMILQHAKRIPFGPLPAEAFDQSTTTISSPVVLPPSPSGTSGTDMETTVSSSTPPANTVNGTPAQESDPETKDIDRISNKTYNTSERSQNESDSVETVEREGVGVSGDREAVQVTDEQRKQAINSIQHMREEDVERILTLSPSDLSRVPDPAQRKQLEILQQCLIEMTRELQSQ